MKVVFVPGFTQSATAWRPVIELLPDVEVEADLVTLEVPDARDFVTTAAAIGDLGGPAAYVGYSMGGRLCLQLALDRPEIVERLVLVSATPGIADPSAREERRAADDALAASIELDGIDAFLDRWLAQPMFANLPAAAADLDRRRANSVERLTHQLRVLGQGSQPSNWERLEEVRAQTALFVGSNDTKYLAIAEQMAAPLRAAMRVLSGCGHACHLEAPPLFSSLLRSWLRG